MGQSWLLQTFSVFEVWNWQLKWHCKFRNTRIMWQCWLLQAFTISAVWNQQPKWPCKFRDATIMWQCWPLQTTVTWAVSNWQLRMGPCPSWSAWDWTKTSSPGIWQMPQSVGFLKCVSWSLELSPDYHSLFTIETGTINVIIFQLVGGVEAAKPAMSDTADPVWKPTVWSVLWHLQPAGWLVLVRDGQSRHHLS